MKHWIWAVLALLVLAVLPSPGTELGQLHPVSLLEAGTAERQVYLKTDTNQIGWGETLDAAIEDLEQTTPGHLFLDTVQTLIVRPDAQFLLDDFRQLLRPDVRVCQSSDELDLERVGEYLGEHTPETKLMDADADTMLPTLRCTEGRCILEN